MTEKNENENRYTIEIAGTKAYTISAKNLTEACIAAKAQFEKEYPNLPKSTVSSGQINEEVIKKITENLSEENTKQFREYMKALEETEEGKELVNKATELAKRVLTEEETDETKPPILPVPPVVNRKTGWECDTKTGKITKVLFLKIDKCIDCPFIRHYNYKPPQIKPQIKSITTPTGGAQRVVAASGTYRLTDPSPIGRMSDRAECSLKRKCLWDKQDRPKYDILPHWCPLSENLVFRVSRDGQTLEIKEM